MNSPATILKSAPGFMNSKGQTSGILTYLKGSSALKVLLKE